MPNKTSYTIKDKLECQGWITSCLVFEQRVPQSPPTKNQRLFQRLLVTPHSQMVRPYCSRYYLRVIKYEEIELAPKQSLILTSVHGARRYCVHYWRRNSSTSPSYRPRDLQQQPSCKLFLCNSDTNVIKVINHFFFRFKAYYMIQNPFLKMLR